MKKDDKEMEEVRSLLLDLRERVGDADCTVIENWEIDFLIRRLLPNQKAS